MKSRFRVEWPQLIIAILTLIAMVIIPELRNLFGLHAVAGSEPIVEGRGSLAPQTSTNATPTDDPLVARIRLDLAKSREARSATASKIESRRVSPAGTVESLEQRRRLRVAIDRALMERRS